MTTTNEDLSTHAPAAPSLDVNYLATLGVFAACAIAALVAHDHVEAAFAALCTFAGVRMAAPTLPARVAQAARFVPLAVFFGAAAMGLGGCSPAQLAAAGTIGTTAAHVTCAVVEKAHAICESLGLAPGEPCPQAEAVLAGVEIGTGEGAPKGCDW